MNSTINVNPNHELETIVKFAPLFQGLNSKKNVFSVKSKLYG